MRRYDSYKDSGIKWIGEIPSHWVVKKFGSISYMKGRIGWQGLKQAEFTNNVEDPFLITGMNFHDGVIRWDEVYHISEERYNEAPEIQLKESDVLFTKDGTIGKLLFVDSIPFPNKASLNSHLLVLRPLNGSYEPRFLYYQLKGLPFKHHVELTKTGTTFYGITQEAMGQYQALLPTPEEQTAIAQYLDHKTAEIDELIANKKRLLELYEEEKTAIISQAVTKGINPGVSMKDSGVEWLGEIPEHWEVKRVKHVLKSLNNIRVPLSADERGKMINRAYDYYGASGIIDKVEDYLFDEPLLLIGEDGANLVTRSTRLAFIARGKYWVNNHAHILKPTFGVLEYWCELLELCDYSIWISGSAQPKLTSENLMNIQVIVPPIEEQNSIISFLEVEFNRINNKKVKTEKLIELLAEYRTALISEVVTGKIKVID